MPTGAEPAVEMPEAAGIGSGQAGAAGAYPLMFTLPAAIGCKLGEAIHDGFRR